MRTIREHSRTVAFLSLVAVLAMVGMTWWLLAGSSPTNAQVIADACDGVDEAESGSMTGRNFPAESHLAVMTVDFNPAAARFSTTIDGVMVEQRIYITPPDSTDGTRSASGKTVYQATQYDQVIEDDGQLGEWTVEETEITGQELPTDSFCGFAPGELSGLRYVGKETVNGVSSRHYTAIKESDGFTLDMWIGPNGLPVRFRSTAPGGAGGLVADFSGWDEPNIITAPAGVTPAAPVPGATATPAPTNTPDPTSTLEPTAEPTPAPGPTDAPAPAPTAEPALTPTPEPTATPRPTNTPAPGAWLSPDPSTITLRGEWRVFRVRGTGSVNLKINVLSPGRKGTVLHSDHRWPPPVSDPCNSPAPGATHSKDVGDSFRLVGCRSGKAVVQLLDPTNSNAVLREYVVKVRR